MKETWRDATGSSWTNRIVQVMLIGAPLVGAFTWHHVRPNQLSNGAFENAEFTVIFAAAGLGCTIVLFFAWYLLTIPSRLHKEHKDSAEKAEAEREPLRLQVAELEVRLSESRTATQSAQLAHGGAKRRLEAIRPYLERLQATDKLEAFDRICTKAQMPVPPKPSGDDQKDHDSWIGFLGGFDPMWKLIQNQAQVGALSDDAMHRIREARNRADVTRSWPEEEGVIWPTDGTRRSWVFQRATIEQYLKERADEKQRLEQAASPLTRAKDLEEILNLMPKEEDASK